MKKNVFQEDFLDGIDEIKLDDLTELDFDLDFEGNIEKDLCIQGYMVSVPKKFADVPRKHIKASKAVPLAKELCQLKEENTFVNAVIPGDFVFCDLLEAIANELGRIKLCIGTLSYSYENVDTFRRMFENGTLEALSMVVSDYFYAHERRGVYRYTLERLPLPATNIAVAGLHTKIHLIEDEHGNKYVLEGSANLRSSQNVEQFVFMKSKSAFEFHEQWLSQLLDKYSVINREKTKSPRGSMLWDFINQ